MASTDLKQIERYGKNIRNVDTYTWNKERIKVAELAFQEKFTQNSDLKEQLLATFPRTMVYAITKDRFWGIGLSEQNPKALVMKEWKGDNVLGFTLTKIRDKLMENRLEEGGDGQDQRVEGQVSRDSMRQDGIGNSHVEEGQVSRESMRQGGGGNSIGVGEQSSWDSKRQHGIGNSHVVKAHTSRDSTRQGGKENSHVMERQVSRDSMWQGTIGNSHRTEGQLNRDSLRQGGIGNSHRVGGNMVQDSMRQGGGGDSHVVEGQVSRDSLRQGTIGNSHRTEGQVSRDSLRQGGIGNSHRVGGNTARDSMRQDGGGNSLGVGEQASWDSKRQHGIENSHVVKAHTSRDSTRQGGIENSHVVEGQVSRDSRRQGGIGNSHRTEGQLSRDSLRQGGIGNSHRVEGNTVRDSMSQDGGRNSHVAEGHASQESLRQGGGGASQRTEGKTSRAYQEQGGDSKGRGVEGPTSQSMNRQGGKGKSQQLERPATHGSYRQDGRGWRRLEVGHRENHDGWEDQNWRDRSEVEWEKRGQPVTGGGEYKESEMRSDWQKVTEEMPQWEETEPTSRPKRKMTQEQTDYKWNKHGRRNMGPRNTKTSYTEVPNQDKFVLFFGNQSPFSQHHPATFTIDGTTFNCAEQYMMYQKTVIFENKEMERKIMETSNPLQQERHGRQIPEFKFEVWKKHFIEVVDRATEAKFSQNPHLLEHLVATYPKLLVEASPSDRLWGIGRGQTDPLAWDKETWRGKNQLGYIITRVRDRLMEVEDTHWEEWEKWKDDKRWEEEFEKDVRRKKRNKRRWEPYQSVPYRGRHEERTPKTRREGDGAEEDSISFKHVSGKDNFEFFGGIKSPFSQLYSASFTIDGQTFTSAEHFTLYQMAVIFEDQECQEKIMSTNDPSEQELYAYEIPNFRWDVWEQKCIQVVELGITAKFSQNSDLKEQLFATSPKLLAECKYDDNYWSIGYGLGFAMRKCEAWDTNKWRGKNVLGYTLTAVRDRLMKMEKGQKELYVEDVSHQATIEGKGVQLDRKILVAEEAGVGGEDGEDVTTEKDEIEVDEEIRRTDRDVEEDESKPHKKQDVKENLVSEEEEVTVGGSELRRNEDADSTLAGDRDIMECDQRERNSLGEGGNNGYVSLKGEDDGREDKGIAWLDSTEVGEGNVAEQHKVEKTIGKELKKVEEVTPLAERESLTKVNGAEEGDERTENEEMETLENGGEKLTLVESGVEGENATKERGMRIEEQLDVGGKTVGEVAKFEEVSKVVADVGDRVEEDERVTVDQQESVGEKASIEEGVAQILEEEPFVEGGRGEREASERLGTGNEVKKEKEVTSVQEGTERDGEGGRKLQEQVKKEGDNTGKDVKTAEDDMSVPSDIVGYGEGGRKVQERVKKDGDNTGKGVKTIEEDMSVPPDIGGDGKGRRKVQERFEKEGNDTGEEEVPLVEAASVVDGGDTKKDPRKVNSELNGMVEEDVAEGVCKDVKKLNEAKSGEDVMSVPEDNVVEREGEGERKDPDHKTGASDILDESKTEKRMPEASTLFEEKYADESQTGDEEEVEKGDTGDGKVVKTEEEVHKTEDENMVETDEGREKGLELVGKECERE